MHSETEMWHGEKVWNHVMWGRGRRIREWLNDVLAKDLWIWMREEGRYMLVVAITCPLDTETCWLATRWWPAGASWSKRDFQTLYTKRFPLGQCFFHGNRLDCVAMDRFWQSMLSFFATIPTIPYCLHLACFIHLLSLWHPYIICVLVISFYSGVFLTL